MRGALAKLPRAEQWANQINVQLGRSVEAIVTTGSLLLKAKADLAHGEWGRMFHEQLIPLSQDTATRYMAIASHPIIANSAHVRNLPPSYSTLYELTKLPEPTLKHALKDGLITPSMERKEVKALVPPQERPRQAETSRPETHEEDEPTRDEPEPEAQKTWADPLEPSTQRVSDISEQEANSAMTLRQIKRMYGSLTRKHRAALKEWINERS